MHVPARRHRPAGADGHKHLEVDAVPDALTANHIGIGLAGRATILCLDRLVRPRVDDVIIVGQGSNHHLHATHRVNFASLLTVSQVHK